ncbi:MAG: hypothetical protein PVJ67_00725 [Candidatus Pacearchaeota archaeon]|jgi:hypothetical protein
MKQWMIFLFVFFSFSFVSAYYGSYYGGGFSLSDLLNEIDSETMLLGVTFIISFALINLSLARVFKDNKQVAGIVAFCIALFIAWGINKSGFDLENIFYSIGISEEFLLAVSPLVLGGIFIYSVIKWGGNGFIGFGITLAVFGVIFFYEKFLSVFIGGVLIVIGWVLNKVFPKQKTWLEKLMKKAK